MNLSMYKLIFVVFGLIGILLIASPIFADVLQPPKGEAFSELYLLNSDHKAYNYPYNIVANQNYSMYVGVGDHLGSSAYYILHVSLRNQTDSLPNATKGTPSSLEAIYEYRFLVQDGHYWEGTLKFSILDVSINNNQSLIKRIMINNEAINIDKPSAWVTNSTTYFYQLLLELWVYNPQSNSIGYHNRYVNLPLNITTGTLSD